MSLGLLRFVVVHTLRIKYEVFQVLDDPADNYLYMVFEYVERRSLLELPTDNPLDEETAWKYFRYTLKGLEYCKFVVFELI